MDFDNIPSLKPFKEISLTDSSEKDVIIDNDKDKDKHKDKKDLSNGIDNYLSYKFINDYFTLSTK